MWIIDGGALNLFQQDEYVWNVPRLIIYDLTKSPPKLIRTFTFPDSVLEVGATFLNDIVVDIKRNFAFISNAGGDGGIFVYDFDKNAIRFWRDSTTAVEPGATTITVEGNFRIVCLLTQAKIEENT